MIEDSLRFIKKVGEIFIVKAKLRDQRTKQWMMLLNSAITFQMSYPPKCFCF